VPIPGTRRGVNPVVSHERRDFAAASPAGMHGCRRRVAPRPRGHPRYAWVHCDAKENEKNPRQGECRGFFSGYFLGFPHGALVGLHS